MWHVWFEIFWSSDDSDLANQGCFSEVNPGIMLSKELCCNGSQLADYSQTKSLYSVMTGLHIIMMTEWWQSWPAWGLQRGGYVTPGARSHFKTIFRHRCCRHRRGKSKVLTTNKFFSWKMANLKLTSFHPIYILCLLLRNSKKFILTLRAQFGWIVLLA